MSRPNRCGVGAHFPGGHEYRVLIQPSWKPDGEWITARYTEFLDQALDLAAESIGNGQPARVEECTWREVKLA